jgi:CIC family chloride channel protein
MSTPAPTEVPVVDRQRMIFICILAASLGIWAALVAKILLFLIDKITGLFFGPFFQIEFGAGFAPINHGLGYWVVLAPVLGGLIVGLMARFGSEAIRGHGIPEAMENILLGRSRISPRVLLLKPLSAAISIGSGGPFGAEGPIIQTGGALGSVLSQFQALTAAERKAMLAAGAAAGMTATFQAPVAAVLLAVELLLFELRPRSLLPVAIACAVASGMRILFFTNGDKALFDLNVNHGAVNPWQLPLFVGLGLAAGLASVVLTKSIYFVEDTFRKLPLHWMWWPAIGGLAAGLVGLIFPAALGVGYDVIANILNNRVTEMNLAPWAGGLAGNTIFLLAAIAFFKTIAWCISLGSGTSGGVLAPILMIGSSVGGALGLVAHQFWPDVEPTLWAEVCMAGVFAGTTRAPLTSIVFVLELTQDLPAFLPLLLVCAVSNLVSVMFLRHSIMTEKIARRGLKVANEYELDVLAALRVQDVMTAPVQTVPMNMRVEKLFELFYGDPTAHRFQAYPVVDDNGKLVGMVSQDDLPRFAVLDDLTWLMVADLMTPRPVVAYPDEGLQDAAQRMVVTGEGRLPVVERSDHSKLLGILSHRDVLKAMAKRLEEENRRERFYHAASWLVRSANLNAPAKSKPEFKLNIPSGQKSK